MSVADRRAIRFSANIRVQFRRGRPADTSDSDVLKVGQISNVTWRGFFVVTDSPEPPGTEVTTFIPLAGHDEPLALCGRVVSVADESESEPERRGMGIRFERNQSSVSPDDVLARVHFKSAEVMTEVPTASIQLAILGLPQISLDETFRRIMAEVRRTLSDNGVVVVWSSDHYAEDGRIVLVHDEVRTVLDGVGLPIFDHKIMFRQPQQPQKSEPKKSPQHKQGLTHLQFFSAKSPWRVETEGYASNVWVHTRCQTVGAFEDGLNPDVSEMLIRTFTRRGDRVLAPFAGSGTNLAVALKVQREAVGYEINPAMREVMVERTLQLDEFYTDMNDVASFMLDSFLQKM